MMFLELHEGTIGLDDMKRIVHKLLENKAVFRQLSPELYSDLAYIITPTLASDHNEANIRAKFREVKTAGRRLAYFRKTGGWSTHTG